MQSPQNPAGQMSKAKPHRLLFPTTATLVLLTSCGIAPSSNMNSEDAERPTSAIAAVGPSCGNGIWEPALGEQCDDGNFDDGDGCDGKCRIEPTYQCEGTYPSVCAQWDHGDAPPSYGIASHKRALPSVSPFIGREYWTAFPHVATDDISFVVTGTQGTFVQLFNSNGSIITATVIDKSGVAKMPVPFDHAIAWYSGFWSDRGIRLVASADVQVVATINDNTTATTFRPWTTAALGTDYIVLEPSTSTALGGESGVLVLATDSNTFVTIRDSNGWIAAGPVFLNAGETFGYAGYDISSGWRVQSNKPIAVIAGNSLADDVGPGQDAALEQLPPVDHWGREYVVASTTLASDAPANHWIVGSQDNTTITITGDAGQSTAYLHASETLLFHAAPNLASRGGWHIRADKPIAVVSNVGDPAFGFGPSMIIWPPVEGYRHSANMPNPNEQRFMTNNFMTVFTRTATTHLIRVNGGGVPEKEWHQIGSSGYSFSLFDRSSYGYDILAVDGATFGAVAVGGVGNKSYAYTAPYNVNVPGSPSTSVYLGSTPPDFEDPIYGNENCDVDDWTGIDDEDAIEYLLELDHGDYYISIEVPCNDWYANGVFPAGVSAFIDFNRNGIFDHGEQSFAFCQDTTKFQSGRAWLSWKGIEWGDPGPSVIRLRICEGHQDCSSPDGPAESGEVEDHRIRILGCGDGEIHGKEQCDDGNWENGDGCSATCDIEAGYDCAGMPSFCWPASPPTIDSPTNGSVVRGPSFDVVGTCLPGTTVYVKAGKDVVCSERCTSSGTYSCSTPNLPEDLYELLAYQLTDTGAGSLDSQAVFVEVSTACWIGGSKVLDGSTNPSKPCQYCDSANSPNAWTNLTVGTACGEGNWPCATDTCDKSGECEHAVVTGCEINGACFEEGPIAGNLCMVCSPSTSTTQPTPIQAGITCDDDGIGWTIDACDGSGNCTHTHSGKCDINGTLVDKGTVNPENACQWCNPSATASGWSPKPKGASCDEDDLDCTADICDGAGICHHPIVEGCVINGECFANRAASPDNECLECNAAYSTTSFSPKPNGELCSEHGACDGSGRCWPRPFVECTIDGTTQDIGMVNPSNHCQVCDPMTDPTGWVNRARGTPCEDDGLPCTSNLCDGSGGCHRTIVAGCVIDDTCVSEGAKDPDSDCRECIPARSRTAYSSSAKGSVCKDDGSLRTQDVCDGLGKCVYPTRSLCIIGGRSYDAGTINPGEECQWCSPSESVNSWSDRPRGSVCSSDGLSCTDDVCDGAGKCGNSLFQGCLVKEQCVGVGGVPEQGECLVCNPVESTTSYTEKPTGSVCGSLDGNFNEINLCNDKGNCVPEARGSCSIDGKIWPGGTDNPDRDCEWCAPGTDSTHWILRAENYPCGSDGLTCTVDKCDIEGACLHPIKPGNCAIDDQCMGEGAHSDTDPCMVCDPERSTTEFVPSESDECLPGCKSNGDCDPGYECEDRECIPVKQPVCGIDFECHPGTTCVDGACVPITSFRCDNDDECDPGHECNDGVCIPVTQPDCMTSADCEPGSECEEGVCVAVTKPECNTHSDCGPDQECVDNACVAVSQPECKKNDECAVGFECVDGKCVRSEQPECKAAPDCGPGHACIGGQCIAVQETECIDHDGCSDGHECHAGTCRPMEAQACSSDNDCPGMMCVAGQCKGGYLGGGGCIASVAGSRGEFSGAGLGMLALLGLGWARWRMQRAGLAVGETRAHSWVHVLDTARPTRL